MTATINAAYPQLPDKQFFTIGEAATLAGTKSHIVRYWEREINVLTKVSRRRGGRRYYTVEEVLLLRRINDLINNEGYTIAGARSILVGSGKESKDGRDGKESKVVAATKKSLRCELERIITIL